MKEKKLQIFALFIPISFICLLMIRRILEQYFRGSFQYRFFYSYGSTIFFFFQLLLILASLVLPIYILTERKHYSFKTQMITLLIGSSLFLYIAISMLVVVFRDI
jgi:hypothetical protein